MSDRVRALEYAMGESPLSPIATWVVIRLHREEIPWFYRHARRYYPEAGPLISGDAEQRSLAAAKTYSPVQIGVTRGDRGVEAFEGAYADLERGRREHYSGHRMLVEWREPALDRLPFMSIRQLTSVILPPYKIPYRTTWIADWETDTRGDQLWTSIAWFDTEYLDSVLLRGSSFERVGHHVDRLRQMPYGELWNVTVPRRMW